MTTAGTRFAQALAAKDVPALAEVQAEDVDFRGLTPGRTWEGTGPDAVIEVLLGSWFEPQDTITGAEITDGEPVEDTAHVRYRFDLTTPDGGFTAEQQVYYRTAGDRISHLRVLCSGFRPAATPA